MGRFLEYIVFFLLGYKIIKMLFADDSQRQTIPQNPPKQNINFNQSQQNTSSSPNSKFNDAEFIDYEEVK